MSKQSIRDLKDKSVIVVGTGRYCPKCKQLMERRKRVKKPLPTKSYFFTEWDYCKPCGHVQHYEQYKSAIWLEEENARAFFKSI